MLRYSHVLSLDFKHLRELLEIDKPEPEAAPDGMKALMARGFLKPGDAENRLGYYVGEIHRQAGAVIILAGNSFLSNGGSR